MMHSHPTVQGNRCSRCPWFVCCCLAILLTCTWSTASAQRPPLGQIQQNFGVCSLGPAYGFSIAFATVPSIIFLIGNGASRGKGAARSWGISGAIIAGAGLTADIGLVVAGTASNNFRSGCDGGFAALSITSLLIHIANASLSTINIVQSERRLIRSLIARRKQIILWRRNRWKRRARRRRERRLRKMQKKAASANGAQAVNRRRPPAQRPVLLNCEQVYKFYRNTLNDALIAEDKDSHVSLLDKLQQDHSSCFKGARGKIYLQQRQSIFEGIAPRLPHGAPLPPMNAPDSSTTPKERVVPAQPDARRPVPVRPTTRPPVRGATPPLSKTPPRREATPPTPRKNNAIPDSILNQIAAGKLPVTRKPAKQKPPQRRRPTSKKAKGPKRPAPQKRTPKPSDTRETSAEPPPSGKNEARNTWLQLDL